MGAIYLSITRRCGVRSLVRASTNGHCWESNSLLIKLAGSNGFRESCSYVVINKHVSLFDLAEYFVMD